jgi:uncharacterized membrane protein
LVLGTLALTLARFGGGLFFAVLTLPTTVNLAASYNQDGLMLATCVLAVSLLTRGRRSRLVALLLLSCVVSAKLPYAPLLLCGLLPLRAPGFWQRVGWVLAACIPPMIWLLHIIHSGFMPNPTVPYHPGPLWPGSRDIWLHDTLPRNNIKVLLAHPIDIVKLPVVSIIFFWHITWTLILGMIGCDRSMIFSWEYPCLVASLTAAALSTLCERVSGWYWTDAALVVCALFAAFISMELSLYLTFTPAGWPVVFGVQSRYFLPFLPFFVFVFGWSGVVLSQWSQAISVAAHWFYLPPIIMAFVNAFALPLFIFHLYHANS